MTLQIYNTLSRRKEEFKPIKAPKVGMYVCGVTVYDECHVGHARALINFDVVYRYLSHKGYKVTFVRNFTDVDDKIIARAEKENIPWDEISRRYIETFHRDMESLGVKKPTFEPKATEHIADMLELISKLEKKKIAYAQSGDVFYSVRTKSDYGKLSGKRIEELEAGARIEIQESKKDPLDFALWKKSKPGEPLWESPWGQGRPGWHIECSAMSMKLLGETFDIHGGGRDLSFPHHENEIAQSEGATGKPFARYWIHNGFVNINAEKMSKSKGNFLTIRELLEIYHPEVVRFFILAAHYRSPLDYTEQNMDNAKLSLGRWYSTLERLNATPSGADEKGDVATKISKLSGEVTAAMDDDFNTAKVVGLLFDLVRDLNKQLDEGKSLGRKARDELTKVIAQVHEVMGVFGSDPSAFLQAQTHRALQKSTLTPGVIEAKITDRNAARKNKDYAQADVIRKELLEAGVQIKDNPDGTTSWSLA